MDFKNLFDVFSRRNPQSQNDTPLLTPEFRHRVLMLCDQKFTPIPVYYSSRINPNSKIFWQDIHDRLTYLVGSPRLTIRRTGNDAWNFLVQCRCDNFLDFIEYIFRTDMYEAAFQLQVLQDHNQFVEYINDFFKLDDLPYSVTSFVWENQRRMLYGTEQDCSVIIAYPQVIRRDDELTHQWAVEPALTLLRDNQFTSANKEFLKALEDYRKGDYGDCLTQCGSAFESTMKIICDRKGWPYSQTDTASPLLKIVLRKSANLESYLEQPLVLIATLRNKLSSSHGAGKQPRNVPPHLAKYAINATAAAILLLIEECK
jgi:hypothetical protein